MKQAILDTNFILACVKQKIDFFEELKFLGLKILIPKQVIGELTRITKSNKKLHFKEDAKLSLNILNKSKFKKVRLDDNFVDKGIRKYAEKNREIIVATLDRELKNKIKSRKLIIRGKKKLEVV